MREKTGGFHLAGDRCSVAFNGNPTGNHWQPRGAQVVLSTALSVKFALAGSTMVSAPLPEAQSGKVAASLLAFQMASIREHWPSAVMLGLFVVTVIVAAARNSSTQCKQ